MGLLSKSYDELEGTLARGGLWGGREWVSGNTWLCDRHGSRFAAELEKAVAGEAKGSGFKTGV